MAKRFESLAIDHEISLNLHEPSIDEEETCNSESDDDDGEDSVGPCTNFCVRRIMHSSRQAVNNLHICKTNYCGRSCYCRAVMLCIPCRMIATSVLQSVTNGQGTTQNASSSVIVLQYIFIQVFRYLPQKESRRGTRRESTDMI